MQMGDLTSCPWCSETCGSVPADRQRFWLPPGNRGNITLQDNSTGAVYCADLGVPFQPYPPLNGTPIFFAACDVSRIAPQQNFLVIETIVGSVDNVSYIIQNVPSTSFIVAVEDNQAASGYTVQTRAEFSGLDPWGVSGRRHGSFEASLIEVFVVLPLSRTTG